MKRWEENILDICLKRIAVLVKDNSDSDWKVIHGELKYKITESINHSVEELISEIRRLEENN
ncbi:MAG: hypothetical protein ACRC6T_08065 [Sarcina sp.]